VTARLAATAIQREDGASDSAKTKTDSKPASHVRGVVNAHMDATHSDKSA
jgi:hypothetical protein